MQFIACIQVVLFFCFFANNAYAGEQKVDLSKPFVCPDISPNTITIGDGKLNIDGVEYQLTNANASSHHNIKNMIFHDKHGVIEINIIQNRKSGLLSVHLIKFKVPISTVPANANPDHFKEYEIGSSDWGDMKKGYPYLRGEGLGCVNR